MDPLEVDDDRRDEQWSESPSRHLRTPAAPREYRSRSIGSLRVGLGLHRLPSGVYRSTEHGIGDVTIEGLIEREEASDHGP